MFKHLFISCEPCVTQHCDDDDNVISSEPSHELKVEVSQSARGPRDTIFQLDANLLYLMNAAEGHSKNFPVIHAAYTADGIAIMERGTRFEGPEPFGIASTGPHIHELKIWPEFYGLVVNRVKTFEMRRHDRPFMPGDLLQLKEYRPAPAGELPAGYSGRYLFVKITNVCTPQDFPAIPQGFCILSIAHVPDYTVLL